MAFREHEYSEVFFQTNGCCSPTVINGMVAGFREEGGRRVYALSSRLNNLLYGAAFGLWTAFVYNIL